MLFHGSHEGESKEDASCLEWDTGDFLARYTTKSNGYSPGKVSSAMDSGESPRLLNPSEQKVADGITHNHFLGVDEQFCTEANVEERLRYLSQELSLLGYGSFFKSSSKFGAKDMLDLPSLINSLYQLLQRQQKHIKAKDEFEARQMRCDSDNEFLMQNQIRLKQDLENVKREAALLLCREKDQIEKCKQVQQELKVEREEKKRMRADMQHLKKQFYHESKRQEKEVNRLKEKIHQALADKGQDKRMGMDILNSLQRSDGKRGTWKTGQKSEEEMYKFVIQNFEDKEKALLSENSAMRQFLSDVQGLMVDHENLHISASSEDMSESDRALDLNANGQFQMPFHMVREDIENKFKSIIDAWKEKLEQLKRLPASSAPTSHESSPTFEPRSDVVALKEKCVALERELEQCKSLVAGQEKIIQSLRDDYSRESFEKVLKRFGEYDDLESAEQRLAILREQERKFNTEREMFTQHVLQVAKEREEFEKERLEFYKNCISTPVLNAESRREKRAYESNHQKAAPRASLDKFKKVTPTFTSSPPPRAAGADKKISTPSTAELYRFLSLSFDERKTESRRLDGSFLDAEVDAGSSVSVKSVEPVPLPGCRRSIEENRKVHEHAQNVRRAVEERHNRSTEEVLRP